MASNKEEEEGELLLIDVQPREGVLVFPHNCFIKLSNTTNNHVAFKFDTTSTHSYTIRPITGILSPHAKRHVQLMRRRAHEAEVCPSLMQCAGKLVLQSVVVVAESRKMVAVEDEGVVVARELFSKLEGEGEGGGCEHPVHEFEMRVVITGGCSAVSDSNCDEDDAGLRYEEVKLVEVVADECVEVSAGTGVFGFVGESSRIRSLLVVVFGVLMGFVAIVLGVIM